MDGLEDRVRVLEKQVRRYRILNLTFALIVLAWFGFVVWNVTHMQERIELRRYLDGTVRTHRLEILKDADSRPSIVLRTADGGGRIEVFDREGNALAGFDGNSGTVVRAGDNPQFPENRPPR